MPATSPDEDAFLDSDGGPIPPQVLLRLLAKTPPTEGRILHVHFLQGQNLSVRLDSPRPGEESGRADSALENWARALSDRFGGALAVAVFDVRSNVRKDPPGLPSDLSVPARLLRSEMRGSAEENHPQGWSSAQATLRAEFISTVIRGAAERECVLELRDRDLRILDFDKDSRFASAMIEVKDALSLWLGSGGVGRFVVEARPASGHEILEDLISGGGP